MLDDNIRRYMALKQRVESAKNEMETLKEEIFKEMGANKEAVTEDGIKATITVKSKYEYTKQDEMIKWLESHGYDDYVNKTIDSKKMNAELKKNRHLWESLNKLYTVTFTKALSVSLVTEVEEE